MRADLYKGLQDVVNASDTDAIAVGIYHSLVVQGT